MNPRPEYVLEDRLGAGSLAVVYRVRSNEGREYAGKQLHASHAADAEARQRFEQEGQLLSSLRHNHIVAVYGMVDVDGVRTLLLELVRGPTLAELMACEGSLAELEALRLTRDIASGLAAAHGAGLIHRDLKPANILLAPAADGRRHMAKIADFGMARSSALATAATDALVIVGTPDYMAPESQEALAVDPRSDLYALGVVLFELLSGRPPFMAASAVAVMEAHRQSPPPDLPENIAVGTRELVRDLLEKSPSARPQSASSVVRRIDALISSQARAAEPTSALVQAERCPGCGAVRVESMPLCLSCGRRHLSFSAGPYSVLITGPGANADKLDSLLRARLCEWLEAQTELGVDAKSLEKTIPRLPFVLLSHLAEGPAQQLVDELTGLGLECEAWQGRALSHAGLRKKAGRLASRALAGAMAGAGAFVGNFSIWTGAASLLVVTSVTVAMAGSAVKAVAKPQTRAKALPGALRAAADRAMQVSEALQHPRHRRTLQDIFARCVALGRWAEAQESALVQELASACDRAGQLCLRVDRLDAELDLQGGADQLLRTKLQVRDRHASQLLELSASLEGLEAGIARLQEQQGAEQHQESAAALDELRLRVQALEEL